MTLDVEAARAACAGVGALSGSTPRNARGASADWRWKGMTNAVRSLLDERGLDSEVFSAGQLRRLRRPVHRRSGRRARGAPGPRPRAVLGAVGLRRRHRPTCNGNGSGPWLGCCQATSTRSEKVADELRTQVGVELEADGVAPDRAVRSTWRPTSDFKRQVWELTVPLTGDRIDDAAIERLSRSSARSTSAATAPARPCSGPRSSWSRCGPSARPRP